MSESYSSRSRKRQSSKTQPNTPQPDPLTCPRCESTNTKFCYYNYNKTQPRYFCKACKRHWTNGGILRNVPVGGGRKNMRLRPSVMSATTATTTDQEAHDHESKSSLLRPISGAKEDEESYTDIEELKGLGSWDVYGSLTGFTMPESFIEMIENDEDSTAATSMMMTSCQQTSSLSWNDLDTMVLDDLNKPWEDPTFKT